MVAHDVQRCALQASLLSILTLDQLRLPGSFLGEAQVHPQQHFRPVLGLGPSGTGVDHEPGVFRILGSAHLDGELELVGELPRGPDCLSCVGLGRFALLQELRERRELIGQLV